MQKETWSSLSKIKREKKRKKEKEEKKEKEKRRKRERWLHVLIYLKVLKRGFTKIRSLIQRPYFSTSTFHSTLIGMRGIANFARTNLWLNNIHDIGMPSLFLP
jgi:hypothetical protein